MAEQLFGGAAAREASLDSFKTEEGEIDNDKQNESTSKPEVENVVGNDKSKQSEEKKKETSAKKSEEKKDMKHHAVKSTI